MVAVWQLGTADNYVVKARDGGIIGLGRLRAVCGGLPMLADAEGACGGEHAGVDDAPQVGFEEAAVVLDERWEVVFAETEGEREADGARRVGDREGVPDAGKGGAGAGEGLVVKTSVAAVRNAVLGDGADGTRSVSGGPGVGGGGGGAGGNVRGLRGGEAGWGGLGSGGRGGKRWRGRRWRRRGDSRRRSEGRGRAGAEGEDLLVFAIEVELQKVEVGEPPVVRWRLTVGYGGQTPWIAMETAVSWRRVRVSRSKSPMTIVEARMTSAANQAGVAAAARERRRATSTSQKAGSSRMEAM